METQWFEFKECDGEIFDRVYQYQKVTTKVAMLDTPKGTAFPVAVVDLGDTPTLIFQDTEGVILAQFRIVCTLVPYEMGTDGTWR
jgi:hypothetical protein